jgi:phosphogluconate dehydratase
LVAVAQSAGIVIDWNDFQTCPMWCPLAHVRQWQRGREPFQAAGGTGYILRELLDAGLMHADVLTVRSGGLREFTAEPALGDTLAWTVAGCQGRQHRQVPVRPSAAPVACACCWATWGAASSKMSSIPMTGMWSKRQPACLTRRRTLAAFKAGELDRDVVCVVRWQGLKPTACQAAQAHTAAGDAAGQGLGWRWSQTGA